jgi:hypothetical protein
LPDQSTQDQVYHNILCERATSTLFQSRVGVHARRCLHQYQFQPGEPWSQITLHRSATCMRAQVRCGNSSTTFLHPTTDQVCEPKYVMQSKTESRSKSKPNQSLRRMHCCSPSKKSRTRLEGEASPFSATWRGFHI